MDKYTSHIGYKDTYYDYAHAYYLSASLLYNELIRMREQLFHDERIYPFLFLVYHSIELYLKTILYSEPTIRSTKLTEDDSSHAIKDLFNKFQTIIIEDRRYLRPEIQYVSEFINQLDIFSKNGFAFRYPKPKGKKDAYFENIYKLELNKFYEHYSKSVELLKNFLCLTNELDTEYRSNKHTDHLSPKEIEEIASMFPGYTNPQIEDAIYLQCQSKYVHLESSEYKHAINIIEIIES